MQKFKKLYADSIMELKVTKNIADTKYAKSNDKSMFITPWSGPGMPKRKETTPIKPPTSPTMPR